jgi:quercetin dioxygenase-like cupin family protein
VAVIAIGAGGTVGRHAAAAQQLFVVVRGSGWVAGGDGRREPITTGEAVLWDAGEDHQSGTDEGLAALGWRPTRSSSKAPRAPAARRG